MKNQIITVIILTIILVGAGIGECIIVGHAFDGLEQELMVMWDKAQAKQLDIQSFEQCQKHWETMRERLEYFLNHMDITEIDLRLAECKAYILNEDYTNTMAQLSILLEMAKHVPHTTLPTLEHII